MTSSCQLWHAVPVKLRRCLSGCPLVTVSVKLQVPKRGRNLSASWRPPVTPVTRSDKKRNIKLAVFQPWKIYQIWAGDNGAIGRADEAPAAGTSCPAIKNAGPLSHGLPMTISSDMVIRFR